MVLDITTYLNISLRDGKGLTDSMCGVFPQIPCEVISHRLYGFHRCCAEGAALGFSVGAGLHADPYARLGIQVPVSVNSVRIPLERLEQTVRAGTKADPNRDATNCLYFYKDDTRMTPFGIYRVTGWSAPRHSEPCRAPRCHRALRPREYVRRACPRRRSGWPASVAGRQTARRSPW